MRVWTDDDLRRAKNIMSHFTPRELDSAVSAVGELFGERLTKEAVRRAFNRRGMGPLTRWCTGGDAVDVDVSEFEERETVEIAPVSRPSRILIVPDVHAPFHDERALELMVRAAIDSGVDTIVQLGDLIDCYSVSSFVKSPEMAGLTLQQEIDSARHVLDRLDSIGATRKVLTAGNHCARVDKYIAQHAPALHGLVNLPELLDLDARGWTWREYGDYEVVGKIAYTHDLDNFGPHAHSKARDELGKSCVIGHTHRMALAFDSTVCGGPRVGAMFGTLCDMSTAAKYMKRAKLRHWQLGFGTGVVLEDGVTFLRPHPIVGYRCEVDGRVYQEAA